MAENPVMYFTVAHSDKYTKKPLPHTQPQNKDPRHMALGLERQHTPNQKIISFVSERKKFQP